MFPLPGWATVLRRSAAVQLARLRRTLDVLLARLREAIARAAGAAVSGAVRELTERLAVARQESHDAQPRRDTPWLRSSSDDDEPWDRTDERPWDEEREDLFDQQEDPYAPPSAPVARAPARHWRDAAAMGCQAVAWWLRRSADTSQSAAPWRWLPCWPW